jgi:alpha-beta hydrolase superfamily lysophospholipase
MTIFADGQEMTTATSATSTNTGQYRSPDIGLSRKGHVGRIVAGSLFTGALAAGLLAAAPITPPTESGVTGAILLGLALGWAMLAVLSMRRTDQPQPWAVVPAVFMASGGLLLLAFGAPMLEALAWVWPPAVLASTVWMVIRSRRQLRSRIGRVLLYPVIAMLAVASLGSGYETVSESVNAGAHPVEGQLIDVGGHRLYLSCTGSGSPTVVLEPGAGLKSTDLALITPVIARDTRVCVYDRAGRGWSEPTSTRQDGADTAAALHTLLQNANEPGPYVLAGHSFGGLYALTFAANYPQDVAGLVLIDSTAPAADPDEDSAQSSSADSEDMADRASALVAGLARLGIGRLIGVETPSHLRSSIDEYIEAGSSAQAAAALEDFEDKPLVVLTAGTGNRSGWGASQEALAKLSTNSIHRVVDGSTHSSLISDHDDAAATARGILDVVSAVRTAGPVAIL